MLHRMFHVVIQKYYFILYIQQRCKTFLVHFAIFVSVLVFLTVVLIIVGLGKTVQAISLLSLLKEKYNISGPHLIVAPGSTLENWRRELEKWLPLHETVVYHGSQETRGDIRYRYSNSSCPDIILTTYTYFERQSGGEDRSFLYKFKFSYVVYDEAHAIKNMKSQRYQRLTKIKSNNRLLLSGTPIQNNLSELLALMVSGFFEDFKEL